MIIAEWPRLRGREEELTTRRQSLVDRAQNLLDKYRLDVEPDFEYLAEALEFAWSELVDPELLAMEGRPTEEVLRRRAELVASSSEREAEFVKGAYSRLLERRKT